MAASASRTFIFFLFYFGTIKMTWRRYPLVVSLYSISLMIQHVPDHQLSSFISVSPLSRPPLVSRFLVWPSSIPSALDIATSLG